MNIHSIHSIQSTSAQDNLEFGSVVSVTKQGILVRLDSGSTQLSEKAFSCTFNPSINDYVSLIKSPNKGLFITNILQRSSTEKAVLEVDQDFCIRSKTGIHLQSSEFSNTSRDHKVTSESYQHVSHNLDLQTTNTHFQSDAVDSHVGRLMQRIKDSFKGD